MATAAQRSRLLAVMCPHCLAATGEPCSVPVGRRRSDGEGGQRRAHRVRISTLDGGCHDARWRAAGLGGARVLSEVVRELTGRRPERVLVRETPGTVLDRPW